MHKPDPGTGMVAIDSEGSVSVTFDCVCGDFYCFYTGSVTELRHSEPTKETIA
jgi:hypothetical protein